jgi:hypothetical protein
VLCGKWERYPREFAKCRRCRKAKYCGKECQSRAWSEGHRFWCSAREEPEGHTASGANPANAGGGAPAGAPAQAPTHAQNVNRSQAEPSAERLAAALANVANARHNPTAGVEALVDTAARMERRLERVRADTSAEMRANPGAGTNVSGSAASGGSNLAETMQRLGVQNIAIRSRNGNADRARASADSTVSNQRARDRDQTRSSSSLPMSVPETSTEAAVNQTPRASLANMPSTSTTTFTSDHSADAASVEAIIGELMNDPSLARFMQQQQQQQQPFQHQQQPRVGGARRRAGTVGSIQNSPTTATAGAYPWSNTPMMAQSQSGEASTTAGAASTRGHVIRSPLTIDRSETIRAGPAPPVVSSVEMNPRTRDAEMDDGSEGGDDMIIG